MKVKATNQHGEIEYLHSLIDIDNAEDGWYVRYTWVKNKIDNESYVKNYFKDGADSGINIRKQSTHLSKYWEGFNKYMEISGIIGNLVWRVKVLNEINESIDYIEIWRDIKFIQAIYTEIDVPFKNGYVWKKNDKQTLYSGTEQLGFDKWNISGIPGISKKAAFDAYKKFVTKWEKKDNCIINTPYIYSQNPYIEE